MGSVGGGWINRLIHSEIGKGESVSLWQRTFVSAKLLYNVVRGLDAFNFDIFRFSTNLKAKMHFFYFSDFDRPYS